MKYLTLIFIFSLFTATAQGQSLTDQDITGTWQVIDVVDSGSNPREATQWTAAYIDLYPDHRLQVRTRKKAGSSKEYNTKFKNAQWSFNKETQTISATKGNFAIQILKKGNQMFFELAEKGIKLEVKRPI